MYIKHFNMAKYSGQIYPLSTKERNFYLNNEKAIPNDRQNDKTYMRKTSSA